jgi:hypothetical protein
MSKRQEHESKVRERTLAAFAEHQIEERSEHGNLGRWVMRKPGTSNLWVEVVELLGGTLLVHGDIYPQLWAHGQSGAPGGLVCWMGCRNSPSDCYLREKSHTAMGHDSARKYDCEIAIEDARDYIREHIESGYEQYASPEFQESFEDACRSISYDLSHDEAMRVWQDLFSGDEWESYPDWGMVTAQGFAQAWAALVRLRALLISEQKANEGE